MKLTCQSRFIRTNPGLCFTIHQPIHTVPFINYKGVKQNFKKHSTSNENQNKVSPKSYVIHITLLLFSVCSFAIPLSPKNYIHFILYSLRLTLALLLICNISHKRCNEQNTIDQDLLTITRRYLQMGQVIQSFKIIFWQRRDSIILQFSAKKRE